MLLHKHRKPGNEANKQPPQQQSRQTLSSFFLSFNPSSSLKTNIHNPDKTDQQTNKKRNNTQQQQATVASTNKGSGCNVAAPGSQATWAVLIRKDGKKLERKSLGSTTTDGLRTGAAANWSLNLDTMMAGWMGGGGGGRGGRDHQWMMIIIVGQMQQTRVIIKYCKVF